MAGVEEVEFSVTEAIENKLEIVLKADQNIEASIQAGIAAGTKEVSFFKSIFFLCQKQLSFFQTEYLKHLYGHFHRILALLIHH